MCTDCRTKRTDKNYKDNSIEREEVYMKTEWDYTNLAEAYLKRPDYAVDAVEKMIKTANVQSGDKVCDVGAGAAHLTKLLAANGFLVDAVEPNDAMRENGIRITKDFPNVEWYEGVGEHTGMAENTYKLVTFGSSFNVCDREAALLESNRILVRDGYFACLWNHRDLEDPLQREIETILKNNIEGYSYGTRREDQTDIINASGLFGTVEYIEGKVSHKILASDFIEGWKSHGTLYRQAPEKFSAIISEIKAIVESKKQEYIYVPYTTRIWMAKVV